MDVDKSSDNLLIDEKPMEKAATTFQMETLDMKLPRIDKSDLTTITKEESVSSLETSTVASSSSREVPLATVVSSSEVPLATVVSSSSEVPLATVVSSLSEVILATAPPLAATTSSTSSTAKTDPATRLLQLKKHDEGDSLTYNKLLWESPHNIIPHVTIIDVTDKKMGNVMH